MKNGSISEQLKMQEEEISGERKNTHENSIGIVPDSERLNANRQEDRLYGITENHISNQSIDKSVKQYGELGLSNVFGIFSPTSTSNINEPQGIKPKKKKKPNRKL